MTATAAVTYIGHATLLLEIDGVRLLTDPILAPHVNGFLRRHHLLPAVTVAAVDAILISHLHYDHLHLPSLQQLGRKTLLIVPVGSAAMLRRRGFPHVIELAVGAQTWVKGLAIQATAAVHAGRRPPFGPTAACLGFLVNGSQRIYFAGDTDLFAAMADLHEGLDLALLPVWGWGPTLGAGHMDPWRAAKALTLLRPRMAMPIHWGTLHPLGLGWGQPHFLTKPPQQFAAYARALAPTVKVQIVPPGQTLALTCG